MNDTNLALEQDMPNVDDLIKEQNTDAMQWALAFKRVITENNFTIEDMKDESYMVGWFANSMMSMHDWVHNNHLNEPEDLRPQCKINCEWDMGFEYIYDNRDEAVKAIEGVDWNDVGYDTWQEVEADGLLSIEEV